MCVLLLWMEVFPFWEALSDDHWGVRLHKWLILVVQVWGGSKRGLKLHKDRTLPQFSAVFSKSLLPFSQLLYSEGRRGWSHPLGRSDSLWEVHQVHLQAKLQNLSKKQKKNCISPLLIVYWKFLQFPHIWEWKHSEARRFNNFSSLSEFYTPSLILSSFASFTLKFILLHLHKVRNNSLECSENKKKSWKKIQVTG